VPRASLTHKEQTRPRAEWLPDGRARSSHYKDDVYRHAFRPSKGGKGWENYCEGVGDRLLPVAASEYDKDEAGPFADELGR
jgi:hypothetical protein